MGTQKTCADPESFFRGVPTLTFFLVDPNTTKIMPSSACHETFSWRADDGPTLNSFVIFQGIREPYIFCDFSGGGVQTPGPPSGFAHEKCLPECPKHVFSLREKKISTILLSKNLDLWNITIMHGSRRGGREPDPPTPPPPIKSQKYSVS